MSKRLFLTLIHEVDGNIEKMDSYSSFKKILSDGISNLLISKDAILPNILGFKKIKDESQSNKCNENGKIENAEVFSNSKEQTNQAKKTTIKKGEIKSFEIKYLENLALEEDTLTEIKYVNDPKSFSEVSNRIKTLLITIHEENATFAEEVSLDYYFVNKEDEFIKIMDVNYINFLFENLAYDFIIFDIDSRKTFLEAFERSLLNKEEIDSHYFIFYPFCQASTILQNQKASIIKPKQTWQYLNGDFNPEFLNLEKLEVLFSVFYEPEGRTDKIKKFEGILKENNWKLAGNNITNARLLFREVAFRIGKLPKFGA